MFRKLPLLMLTILSGLFMVSDAYAGKISCADTGTCEEATFTSVATDAVILLDLSRNMNLNPAGGETNTYGISTCVADETACASGVAEGNSNYGYSATSTGSCTTDCSRLAIAKRAIFDILDDDNNGVINTQDSDSTGIRFGYLRFLGGDDYPTVDFNNGYSKLIKPIGTTYQSMYCGAGTSGSCTISDTCASGECVANATASGGAGISRAIHETKVYLDEHKAADDAGECRQKFVILITSSSEDCSCESGTDGCLADQCDPGNGAYKRRYQTVSAAKELYDAGYKLFAVGFGSAMPDYLQNTINWIANWGGTDNPTVVNGGNADAFTPLTEYVTTCPTTVSWGTLSDGTCGGNTVTDWYASQNDPGNAATLPISGYAFLATNAGDLATSLKEAIANIRDQTFSFTRVSVQTVRTFDENYLYEASFTPLSSTDVALNDPFWIGHLKKYILNTDGSLPAGAEWDAGTILKNRTGSTRTIYTYKSGSLVAFNTVTAADLGVASGNRDMVVNFVYNGDEAYDSSISSEAAKDNWKLGDIFHSSPICIGTPSEYFTDIVDQGSTNAYATYRAANTRTSANGKRLLVAGANDGQFHVFKTGSAGAEGGKELWSFVPPNLMANLQAIAHTSHATALTHQYFVDGPTTASDVWTGTGDGTSKLSSEWKSYMIISLGRGWNKKLWSSSPYCDTGFSDTSSSTYNQYCGYYAFDVTDTLGTPIFLWHFGGTVGLTATERGALGQPWSKITMGRVRIYDSGLGLQRERWVGFAAGGYGGNGFFVIDLLNGQVLWTFTSGVANNMVGQPASIDWDNDGFIDTVYTADLDGNVWRFKLCELPATGGTGLTSSSCSISDWTGGKFFDASGNVRPIYTKPTVVHPLGGDLWVYFGTGELLDPTESNAQERIYGLKDNTRSGSYSAGSDMENLTGGGDYGGSKNGWQYNFPGHGQKLLSDPTVYGDTLYWTSYTPGGNGPCDTSGSSDLNAVNFATAHGQFPNGERSIYVGAGIASGAVVSENPYGGTNVYVTTSEGSQINVVQPPDPYANKANLQYWHDMRVQ